ncbi:hypothetical protein GQX73_g5535 [Xylaria multiplex]|uniref:Uncharacterized protein n=1 Tax=Xylaria multiplex TaxID=323545 RepID=A0A7C8IRK8_9PEZI|nr:hypothetical protein GQX73_g5535 [Xylaria multiplex]
MVSVSAPSEINKIFRYSKPWKKSDFYKALLMKPDGKPIPGIFATQDEGIHNQLKRPIAGIYSMTTLLSFEPFVDTTMRVLCNELQSRFASTGKPCDLGLWLQMFAFDVIGDLTFSKRLGFLESGTDVNGVMKDLWDMFRQTSLVTQMPWTDNLWTNNPIRRYFRGRTISPGASFAMACVQERREEIKTGKMNVNLETRDFMSRFLEIEAQDEKLPPYALAAWASSNLTAGSDTTGILLRSVFHNLLTNPVSLSRLLDELNTAADSLGPMANWKSARDLPYLDAVIKEAGRLHPSFGLPFERVVPAGGATICGKFLPAGTVVGMSAWAVHHDKDMFGEDCDKWRPERWLDVDGEKRRSMENALLTVSRFIKFLF